MPYPWVNDGVFLQSVITHVERAAQELHTYFNTRFWQAGAVLKSEVLEFEAMQVFCPYYLKDRIDSAEDNQWYNAVVFQFL